MEMKPQRKAAKTAKDSFELTNTARTSPRDWGPSKYPEKSGNPGRRQKTSPQRAGDTSMNHQVSIKCDQTVN
jgi:hypothetical protein